jgi:hypothetical protein
MRNGRLGLLGALVLIAGASCDYDDSSAKEAEGVTTGDPNGTATIPGDSSSTAANSASAGNTGGPGSTGGPGPGNSGGPGSMGGSGSTAPTSTAVDLSDSMDCSNVSPCGGDVVGTWNIASSCLELTGDMDVLLTSLGCPTVPVVGSLRTTGTFVANADGSYEDKTTTTGHVAFPLNPDCLAISGVGVGCDRVGAIFPAVGWKTAVCEESAGQCNCELSTEQEAGLGVILPYTEPPGQYTTMGDGLTGSIAS